MTNVLPSRSGATVFLMRGGGARQHRPEDTPRLFSGMRQSNVAPTGYALSIALKLLGRGQRRALSMVTPFREERGLRPSVVNHRYDGEIQCLL